MSYKDYFENARKDIQKKAVATKILDLMQKLLMDETDESSRRWIWELIQNAVDASKENQDIEISVDIVYENERTYLDFKHNGDTFNIKTLASLINQVSGKSRASDAKTTGKFGTGFLTTHLLSKIVELDGVIYEQGENYKKFNILLDRSGKTLEDISLAVEKTLTTLENIDDVPNFNGYVDGELNTRFRYLLDDNGLNTAKIGINDFHNTAKYVFAFVPKLKSIKVQQTIYTLCDTIHKDGGIIIYKIQNSTTLDHYYILTKTAEHSITTALEITYDDDKISLIKLEESLTRLYCTFPLIGSEKFPLPFVINSRVFYPTEPRDDVFLTNTDTLEVKSNLEIISKAIQSYKEICTLAIEENWANRHLLADFNNLNGAYLIKNNSLKNSASSLFDYLIMQPLAFCNDNTYHPIVNSNFKPQIIIPKADNLDDFYNLTNEMKFNIPVICYDNLNFWLKILPDYTYSPEDLLSKIHQIFHFDDLHLNTANKDDWYQRFIDFMFENPETQNKAIRSKIFVNAENHFKKQDWVYKTNISQDFYEFARKILKELDSITLDNRFTYQSTVFKTHTEHTILDECERYLNNQISFRRLNSDLICDILTYYFDDNTKENHTNLLYFCDFLHIKDTAKLNKLSIDTKNIWSICYNYILNTIKDFLVTECDKCQNISTLATKLNQTEENLFKFYLNFLNFLEKTEQIYKFKHRNKYINIFPNRDGIFLDISHLLKTLEVNDDIIEIADDLNTNTSKYLIAKELNTVNIAQLTLESVCRQITSQVTHILYVPNEKEKYKHALQKLFEWIDAHDEQSKTLFQPIYKNRYSLCDDEVMKENNKTLNSILEKYKVNNIHELATVLTQNTTEPLDVIYDENGNCHDENSEYARKIGELGEKLAFEWVCDKYKEHYKNIIEISQQYILLENDEKKQVKISLADTENYKPSYDIIVSSDDFKQYFEVKTTVHSQSNHMALSQTQVNTLIANIGNYHIILITNAKRENPNISCYLCEQKIDII